MHARLFALALIATAATAVIAADTPLRTLAMGAQSGVQKPERVVVRTQPEWEALWKRSAPSKSQLVAAPKVDWSKEMVLAAFLGSRSTGGYGVRIVGAREVNGKLEVRVEERRPRPDGFVTQAFTAPFHIVAAPKSTLPVVWKTVAPPASR
ncbi:MAG: protease complex subunit PrcB family protein [Actinomycetota bacterium]